MTTTTTTTQRMFAGLCAIGLLASGCPGEEPPGPTDTGQTNGGPDGGNDEVGLDEDAGPEAGEEPDADGGPACEPISECPAGACGLLDDGCGGRVECAPCECVDGAPGLGFEASCGTCGLGVRACAPGVTGASTCEGPDAVDLGFAADAEPDCATQLVYLDPEAAPGGSGDAWDPMAELERAYQLAMERARGEGTTPPVRTLVVAAQGELMHTGGLRLRPGVSLIGGFARGEDGSWAWDASGERARRFGSSAGSTR